MICMCSLVGESLTEKKSNHTKSQRLFIWRHQTRHHTTTQLSINTKLSRHNTTQLNSKPKLKIENLSRAAITMYSYYYNHDPSSFDHVISPPNQHILPSSIPSHLLDQLTVSEFDSVNSSGSTSGCSSYSSPTYETTNMQRSVSSHSLNVNNTPFNSHYLNDLIDSMDASSSSVRRAFSAGDLHVNNCPFSCFVPVRWDILTF